MIEECRLDADCYMCRRFEETKDNFVDYWYADKDHLERCDTERLRRKYSEDNMYCDPWTKGIVQRAGPTLKDLTVYGEDSITTHILEHTPNLTALRLVWHHPLIQCIIPGRRCNSLVTLEFVGQHTIPSDIVKHFTYYDYTHLRALAIFNVASKLDGVYSRSAITVVNIVALGMS